ncbi:acetoin utilization protein AcuC [Rhodococcus sp. BP-252]|uniref:acetoin utilization protein AcuC n=1 Tax=unclassified Rhodococcus (in: high G+C Gram-positive bacteria) TaxID=192944 RepID=UPI001C9B21EA|nr:MULTISPECIES: acetoin utilization protein AcuC [unclassified Rhodococcus (in: high G+C Gram-positive bacteria)]MBY6410961.1 acetoin utilization protein AcuC [Rhodococcus sp. BP-320]MBY6415620.1 acetoin utilization protein AcuC [Rhodococcus sp. BP-321]MBY6420998.1 acetoin utilization protein AcuC [Rhodococcus sp. BP-324]MBY6426053.1 acetoin utilization protein AcuC [Rhodococcus sp. BP-323]MBY6430826.1 acetoin utilization protein AcuC [Rhodococcus sp. BP-322]
MADLAAGPPPSTAAAQDDIVVWSPDYLSYRWSDDHPMNPTRLDLTMSLARSIGVLDGIEPVEPTAASDSELLRIHTPAYIEAVKNAPEKGPSIVHPDAVEHGLGSDDNPVFRQMHEASAMLAGGTLAAAREIASGRARRAVSIGGGMHHAMPDWASGFCVYNDAAIAISWLLDNGFDRIAYIDVDAHHGDGVQHAFVADPRVLTVSLHQHPATLWPNTGWSTEVGTGAAEGTSINVPLLPNTGDRLWLRAFHAVVPGAVAAFRPQIIVSQCGVDSHREDPLADLALTVDGQNAAFLAMRDLADKHADGRWIAVGGGGYGLVRVVPRAWTYLIAAALGRPVDAGLALPDSWRERVRAMAPSIDLPQVMGDGGDVDYPAWDGPGGAATGSTEASDRALERVDSAILATRRAAFPLLGLDPEDPRD